MAFASAMQDTLAAIIFEGISRLDVDQMNPQAFFQELFTILRRKASSTMIPFK